MAQPPAGTATTTQPAAPTPGDVAHEPTALEKLAKEVHGSQEKLIVALATQERWYWGDVALLILGDRKALADAMKKMEEASEQAQAKAADAQHKADEAVKKAAEERAQREGTETVRYVTTTTQQQATAPAHH